MVYVFLRVCFFWIYLPVTLVVIVFMGFAYRVNAKRTADDPQKRDYHPLAVALSPIWPLWGVLSISLFMLRALTYGVFLVLFTIALVVIRKPFLFIWLERVAAAVGNRLLRANMLIVRLFIPTPASQTA